MPNNSQMNLSGLPEWARALSEKYYSGTFAMFVIYGNVHDLVPRKENDKTEFLPLRRFLNEVLFGQRNVILNYDRGGGIAFDQPEMSKDFRNALAGYDQFHGTNYSNGLPRNPDGVLQVLDNFLRLRVLDGKKIALTLDFAETIAPAGDISGMSSDDRNSLVILKRWALDPSFLKSDVTICLVTENLIDLNQSLVQSPAVAAIQIPLPGESERLEFIQHQLAQTPLPKDSDVSDTLLSSLGAGLKRVQLQSVIADAVENVRPLTVKTMAQRKKELIEAEAAGLLEFIHSRFDLSFVAG